MVLFHYFQDLRFLWNILEIPFFPPSCSFFLSSFSFFFSFFFFFLFFLFFLFLFLFLSFLLPLFFSSDSSSCSSDSSDSYSSFLLFFFSSFILFVLLLLLFFPRSSISISVSLEMSSPPRNTNFGMPAPLAILILWNPLQMTRMSM